MSRLRIALSISLFLHISVIAALLINGHFSQFKVSPELSHFEPIIEATVIDESQLQKQVQKVKNEQQAKRVKEENRVKELERRAVNAEKKRQQQETEVSKLKEQTKTQQLERKKAEQAAVAAREKQKQEKAKANQLENDRKRKELEKEQAEEQAKSKRDKEEKALKEAERKRQDEKDKAEQEKMLEEQLQAEQAVRQQKRNKQVLTEVQKYQALIKQTIQRNLIVDDSMKGKSCRLNIRLASNGLVTQVKELGGNTILCRAAKAAVFKSDTLPVSKEADVYQQLREINLTVEPEL
jgi:colicin import membrane protein